MKYNFNQISKLLEKLFKSGFDSEKKILSIDIGDLVKIPEVSSLEIMIILDLKKAIKNKKIIAFLSGNKEEEIKWIILY